MLRQQNGAFLLQSANLLPELRFLRILHSGQKTLGEALSDFSVHIVNFFYARQLLINLPLVRLRRFLRLFAKKRVLLI